MSFLKERERTRARMTELNTELALLEARGEWADALQVMRTAPLGSALHLSVRFAHQESIDVALGSVFLPTPLVTLAQSAIIGAMQNILGDIDDRLASCGTLIAEPEVVPPPPPDVPDPPPAVRAVEEAEAERQARLAAIADKKGIPF